MLQLINQPQLGLFGLMQFAHWFNWDFLVGVKCKDGGCLVDYWFHFLHVLSTVFANLLEFLLHLHLPFFSFTSHLYTYSPLFPPHILYVLILLYSSLPHLSLFSFSILQLPGVFFFFFWVMIACYVVSQLWVIKSNIISEVINGRQCLCVFYSLSLFFHFSLNILTSLLFILTGSSLITFTETSLAAMEQNK